MLQRRRPAPSDHRAFTLIELIVVILILGILAAVAVVGYTQVTDRAQVTRAKANLAQVAKGTVAQASLAAASDPDSGQLTRAQFLKVMTDTVGTVAPELSAAAWELGDHDDAPTRSGQFAVGFDRFDHQVDATAGSRAALVAASDAGDLFAVVMTTGGDITAVMQVPAGTSPEVVLEAIPAGASVPVFSDDTLAPPTPETPAAISAPTGLTVAPADGAVTASWDAVPQAVRYTVTATPLGDGAPIARESTTNHMALTGLVNGMTYLIAVTAYDATGVAAVSDPVTAAPTRPATVTTKFTASDGAAWDSFGRAVAVDGDTVVVGSGGKGNNGTTSGSAYVFARTGTGWTQQAKLSADDAAASDNFGFSVAVSGDTTLIGAYGKGITGAAYVFTRTGTTWTQEAKLAGPGGQFGKSVALDGHTALIGAHGTADNGTASGAAYVYTRTGTTWTQQAKITAADASASAAFGSAVALDKNTALIGAYGDGQKGSAPGPGAAYVFSRTGTTWAQQAKLTAADAASQDQFGQSVALDGDTALIGAYRDDDQGKDSGSAYMFTRTGASWALQAKLVDAGGVAGDYFGYSVALNGNTAAIGAYGDDDNGDTSGAVHLFGRTDTTWNPLDKLTAPDSDKYDSFGYAIALDGHTVATGAYRDRDKGTDSGSVWVMPSR